MTDKDPRAAVNILVDQFAETLAEMVDAALSDVEYPAAEAGYQDGLNDALHALRDYRNQLAADEYDQHYIDGVNDAIITVLEAGAVDSDTTDTTPEATATDASRSAMDRTDTDDDSDEDEDGP